MNSANNLCRIVISIRMFYKPEWSEVESIQQHQHPKKPDTLERTRSDPPIKWKTFLTVTCSDQENFDFCQNLTKNDQQFVQNQKVPRTTAPYKSGARRPTNHFVRNDFESKNNCIKHFVLLYLPKIKQQSR